MTSGYYLFDWSVAFFDQVESASERSELHLLMIETQLLENRRVKVAVIMRVLYGLVSEFVSCAMDRPAFNPPAGKP